MANDIIPFDSTSSGGAVALPEHLQALFGDSTNITAHFSVDQLSYRGKIWRTILGGEETPLTRPSQDTGEPEPLPIVSLIVLDHNKNRSRSYYEGNFEEGKNSAPRCFSNDGVTPDKAVKEPLSVTCATCPMAVKGSKVTDNGKAVTACAPNKRIAVIPSSRIGEHPEMLLRIAQTSVWDKENGENEAKGWYAWDQYLDMLRARGAKHTAVVETRVKFDLRVAYPKLLFSASRWLNPEEAAKVKKLLTDDEKKIADILSGGGFDGAAGQPASSEGAAPAAPAATSAPVATPKPTPVATTAPKAAPKPPTPPAPTQAPAKMVKTMTAKAEGVSYKDFLDQGWTDEQLIENGYMEMKPEAPKAPPKAPKAPKAPAAPSGEQQAAAPAQAAPPAAAPTQAAAPAATVVEGTPQGLSDLLNSWDD